MVMKIRAAAQKGEPVSMMLAGEVGWDFGPAEIAAALKEAKGQPIDVEIFSYGGDAFAGLAIYQQLRNHDAPVTTRVLGIAASAASVIMMGGSRRIVPKNAALMIHPAWSFAMGDAGQLHKQADVLQKVTDALISTYVEATGRPDAEIRPFVLDESWLFGEEAFALSLATEVGEEIEAMSIQASVPGDRFRAIPKELTALLAEAEPPAPAEPAEEPLEEPPAAEEPPTPDPEPEPEPEPAPGSLSPTTETSASSMTVSNAAREDERNRQNTIRAMCARLIANGQLKSDAANSLADKFCNDGTSADAAREELFELATGQTAQAAARGLTDHGAGNIGLSASEIENYSVVNVVRYLADSKSRENIESVGFELDCHRAAEKVPGQRPSDGGVLIPQDVLRSRIKGGWGFRSGIRAAGQEVGDFSKGGALVDTTYLAGSFIDEVYIRSAIMRTGMTMLTGLTGNITIGKQLSGSTAYWVGENDSVSESELAFGLTGLNPKTIGVRVPFSRLSLKQTTPDVEMLARRDMAIKMALGIDKSFLYGSGGEFQPLGLLNHVGLAGVTFGGGTDLVYPAKVGGGTHNTGDWADWVALESQIASEELDVASMVYLLNSTTRSGCKVTLRAPTANSDYIMGESGRINGYGSIVSSQLQTNDVVFGNFADALGGMWGAVDMILDPYTQSAKGQVIITMFQDVDFAVRYLESFVKGS